MGRIEQKIRSCQIANFPRHERHGPKTNFTSVIAIVYYPSFHSTKRIVASEQTAWPNSAVPRFKFLVKKFCVDHAQIFCMFLSIVKRNFSSSNRRREKKKKRDTRLVAVCCTIRDRVCYDTSYFLSMVDNLVGWFLIDDAKIRRSCSCTLFRFTNVFWLDSSIHPSIHPYCSCVIGASGTYYDHDEGWYGCVVMMWCQPCDIWKF